MLMPELQNAEELFDNSMSTYYAILQLKSSLVKIEMG